MLIKNVFVDIGPLQEALFEVQRFYMTGPVPMWLHEKFMAVRHEDGCGFELEDQSMRAWLAGGPLVIAYPGPDLLVVLADFRAMRGVVMG